MTTPDHLATVHTARGPIPVTGLGATLMHEHVFVLSSEVLHNYGEYFDEDERVSDAAARLTELKANGIDTIVDLTVVGLGRSIDLISKVAQLTDINIVVATGLYTFDDVPPAFRLRGPGTITGGEEPMTDLFVRDIEHGLGESGIRAAILKCATDLAGVTSGVERVLRAVAAAHLCTGAPISTHTHAGSRVGLDQQRILRDAGVELDRVVIGHSGDTTDLDYLQQLIDGGSYLGMDRFGNDLRLPFADRVATVAKLCSRGYAERMVLSHDAACYNDALHWMDDDMLGEVAPNWHFLHITRDVLPALRAAGVTDAQITTMLVDNPRRFFGA
jgi:phosphotriesterase-related protein